MSAFDDLLAAHPVEFHAAYIAIWKPGSLPCSKSFSTIGIRCSPDRTSEWRRS